MSYEYVSRLHTNEGLTLKGAIDDSRIIDYLRVILNDIATIEPEKMTVTELEEAHNKVVMTIQFLKKALKDLGKVEERLRKEIEGRKG